jgi:hypothetical protein
MKKANRIVSFDWSMYDQGHVVYRPTQMSHDELCTGLGGAYKSFYSTCSNLPADSRCVASGIARNG